METSFLPPSSFPPTPALSPLLHMFAPEWTDAPISCHYAGLLELSQEAQHDREKTASSCRDQNRSVQLALDQKGLRKPRGITTCGSYMHLTLKNTSTVFLLLFELSEHFACDAY